MTPQNENPAAARGGTGLPSIVQLGGFERANNSPEPASVQGAGSAPLFYVRTRSDALRAARELNAAASRCRTAARTHPGATGLTLDRLAAHYAKQAARFFRQADALPEMAVRA